MEDLLRSDGALCLTFVNTASPRRQGFETYGDLLAWSVAAGALDGEWRPRLERTAAERPAIAAGVVRRTGTLRGRLRRILLTTARGERPAASDFAPFNAELGAALASRRLVPGAGVCRWSWADEGDGALDRMLWPVLLSAGELLASDAVLKVRRCPHDDCGLLFVARGGGRPRKWCSLACGNRSTSRKHYRRKIKPERQRQKKVREQTRKPRRQN